MLPEEAAQWIHVWYWLRYVRRPPVFTPMPQHDDPGRMSRDEYRLYTEEWVAAGSPKVDTSKLLAVITKQALADPLDALREPPPF